MTEAEWLSYDYWRPMLDVLSVRITQRKGLLYVATGLRSIWNLLYCESSRQAVASAERLADGEATDDEIRNAAWSAEVPTFGFDFEPQFIRKHMADGNYDPGVRRLLEMGVYTEADIAGDSPLGDDQVVRRLSNAAHIAYHSFGCIREDGFSDHILEHMSALTEWPGGWLVRDIFGNPFRPVAFSPGWRTAAAVALAESMYQARDFAAMPILADALQDAGCENEDILSHCRGPGPHVRGCWVVDLVTGRE